MNRQKQKHTVRNIDGVTHFVPKRDRSLRFDRVVKSRIGIIVAVVIVVALGILLINRLRSDIHNLDTPQGVKAALSKHMIVPNEQPVIATVTDRSALKTPFLKEANDGDKVVIFEKAKRVVIYRPTLDKIVDIGPVELSNIPKTNN